MLVADDNKDYGVLLSRFVASQPDMEVVGLASDGGEAVDLVSQLDPDVVLMDLCMPGVDGFQAMRALSAIDRDVKVIAITAHRSDDFESRSLDEGACAFIRKADVDRRLVDVIREMVRDEGSDADT